MKSVHVGKPRLLSLEDEQQAVDYFQWWAKHGKPYTLLEAKK
jgi:hypothetical protein